MNPKCYHGEQGRPSFEGINCGLKRKVFFPICKLTMHPKCYHVEPHMKMNITPLNELTMSKDDFFLHENLLCTQNLTMWNSTTLNE